MLLPALLFLSLLIACAPRSSAKYADTDGDGFTFPEDCDETSANAAAIYPGADEVCDGVDNDCDGQTDEEITTYLWYRDADLDGFGEEGAGVVDCEPPDDTNWALIAGDCDDSKDEIHPNAIELCNSEDDDCDGATDEDVAVENGGKETWRDGDGDGEGDMYADPVLHCEESEEFVLNNRDCDDGETTVWTGAEELCETPVDDDCNSLTNDEEPVPPVDATLWCVDDDGGGFSAVNDPGVLKCEAALRTIVCAEARDNNDGDTSIYPGAPEYCDLKDNDQDGGVDEEPSVDPTTWYRDYDTDGHGSMDPAHAQKACVQPLDYVATNLDCDDERVVVHGAHAELCGDGLDNDCDSLTDSDSGCIDYNVQSATEWFAGHVNGDHFEDVILYLCGSSHLPEHDAFVIPDVGTTTSYCWAVAFANSATKARFHKYNLWSESAGKDADERWVVDVDGDGAVDLVWVEDTDGDGVNEWRVALADQETQSFLTQVPAWMDESIGAIHTGMSDSEHRLMGDVNGDGMADIVYVDGVLVYVSFGTGTTFGALTWTTAWSLEPTLYYTAPDKFMLADVNKDGRDDLVVFFVDNIDELEDDGTDKRGTKNEDVYNYKDGLPDVDGAWLVMTSSGSGFNGPAWWLGVNDGCNTTDVETGDGCGNWADDVFVADVISDSSADAIGFYEREDELREGVSNGTFYGGASNAANFNSAYETNHLLPPLAGFAAHAVRSTFTAEGSYGHSYTRPRAILFADVNGDGKEDALAFQSSDWEVALVGTATSYTFDTPTSWGP